jgi:hypothetical protein
VVTKFYVILKYTTSEVNDVGIDEDGVQLAGKGNLVP